LSEGLTLVSCLFFTTKATNGFHKEHKIFSTFSQKVAFDIFSNPIFSTPLNRSSFRSMIDKNQYYKLNIFTAHLYFNHFMEGMHRPKSGSMEQSGRGIFFPD
jgi:hypothetical protein